MADLLYRQLDILYSINNPNDDNITPSGPQSPPPYSSEKATWQCTDFSLAKHWPARKGGSPKKNNNGATDDNDNDGESLHFDSPIDPNKKFSFVHISKCAGSSWIQELQTVVFGRNRQQSKLPQPVVARKGDRFFPMRLAGVEKTVADQKRLYQDADYMMISLRSPRHHVLSQFLECKHGGWPPMAGTGPFNFSVADAEGLHQWLDFFVQETRNADTNQSVFRYRETTEKFKCYHPANFQSRFLTSNAKHGQSMDVRVGFEPNTTMALQTLQEDMVWIGLQDFFHESKCLLYFRVLLSLKEQEGNYTNPLEKELQAYVDETCHCRGDAFETTNAVNDTVESMIRSNKTSAPKSPSSTNATAAHLKDSAVLHHSKAGRTTLDGLPDIVLSKMDALIRSDVVVYQKVLQGFILQIKWMENQLQRRVLCDKKLQSAQPQLAYLDVNLLDLYFSKRRKACWGIVAALVQLNDLLGL